MPSSKCDRVECPEPLKFSDAVFISDPEGLLWYCSLECAREEHPPPEDKPMKCEFCGTREHVDFCLDPYLQEVDGIEVWAYLCDSCHEARWLET